MSRIDLRVHIRKLSLVALGLIGLAGFVVAGPLQARAAPSFVTTQGSRLMYQGQPFVLRGVNFNNETALACCGGPDINLLDVNQTDYAKAHQLGVNHLRWGLDYNWYASNRTQFFSVLDQHLAWATQYQMWVYLVDFIPPGGSSGGFDQSAAKGYCIWSDCATSPANQTLLNNMWQDIAQHYASNPTVIGYDPMNEPAPPADSEWHSLVTRLYNTITAADPNHLVIIEAPLSNDLSLFTQTSRVIYSVHHYPGGDNFPAGQPANTPMIVGEFGDVITSASAVTFVTSEIARYNAAGVNWTYFVWREDPAGFGLYSTYTAGDFSAPWTPMIAAVQTGWAGNVFPAGGAPPPPSPTPTPTPPPPPPPPPSGVPVYDHIFEILMENTPYSGIIGNSAAPYINSLAAGGAIAGNYFAVDHPSLPNYMALSAGQSFSWAPSDCDAGPGCQTNAVSIADRIEGAGKTWREYAESMGAPCQLTSSGSYYARHNPFVYFTGITGNPARCNSHVVDYSSLSTDLASTSSTPNFAFITPNGCNDMHDCSVSTGDTWLSQNVPAILASPAFTQQHSLLIIVVDEDDGTQGNQVAFVATGFGVKTGFTSQTSYNHYSLLKTIESSWGLSTMTTNDAAAAAMIDLFGSGAPPPPLSASSAASRNTVTAPGAVNFTGTATGGATPYSFAWTFGDGSSATTQNPSHTYAAAGTYTVNLTVTDGAAHTASASALTITVSTALSVTDNAGTLTGNAPLAVSFTSTPAGGLAPFSYAWAFGDGGTATSQNPSHTYTAAGSFKANLTVTDANGATASATALTITVHGPLAATASASPLASDAPATVAFTGTGTGGTAPYSYSWAFGDGASAATQNPSHIYSAAGTYTATLTITDAVASTARATLSVVISPTLVASASASATVGAAPLAVNFTGAAAGGVGPFTYAWTFGDGLSSTSQNPSHTYTAAGTYTANLAVTDANLVRANAVPLTITVTPSLGVTTSALPRSGDAPLAVSFTGTPSGGSSPYSYAWTFGDGSSATSQNPSHTYTTAGTFSATLTVTDALGAKGTASALTITVNPLPSAASAANRIAGDAPVGVSFTGSVSGGTAPFSYAWTFGDGGSATSQNPSHTYSTAGTYTVNLTVTDATAHSASASALTITVSPALSVADSASTSSGNAPLAVSFSSTPAGGLAPYTYAWTFGDGSTATTQNPSHTYTTAGSYSANLTVTDPNGGTASASALTITVHGPLAATASASPLAGDAPVTVSFTGTGAGGTAPYSYSWAFGDGSSSTTQNPSHIYSTAGTFTATLTITDAAAGTATSTAVVVVSPTLVVGASSNVTGGAAPLAVNFTGTIAGGLGPFSYAWTFGDGTSSTTQNPGHTYSTAGTYTVNLSVTDANRVRVSAAPFTITVILPLSASSSGGPRTGDAPVVVSFLGTALGGVSPYSYAWTFGDGNSSTSQNPSHTYTAAGAFSAILTVTDSAAHSASAIALTITVSPALSVSDSASTTTGNAPLAVGFTSTPTGGLAPYSYAWTFGDGGTATTQNPSHTYSAAGTFSANLTVSDANGGTASASAINVTVHGPLAATATAVPLVGDAPLTVTFTGTGGGGTPPYTFSWAFGDGSSSATQNPSHAYAAAGTFSATLTVTDAISAKATASALTVTVNPAPGASAAANRIAGDAPVSISFTGSVSGGTAPFSYAWTFGDGGNATIANPSHTYTAAGTYSVNLTVTDASGRSAAASPLTITVSPALSVTTSASPSTGNAPLAVGFTSTPSGGLPPYSYAWTFGDGGTATSQSPSHTFTSGGTFSANLTVTDANGGTSSGSALTITVVGPLSATASATPGIGDAPLTTALNASVTGGKAPFAYAWTLGDGTTSTVKSPNHSYSSVGSYTASVTVNDASGQVSHSSTSITVYPALSVSTSATPVSGVASLSVTFSASASGGYAPYNFTWNYGDGANGSGASATHSYAAGTFHPTLTAHDSAGGAWTGSAGTISVASPPAAPPAPTPDSGSQAPAAPAATETSPSPSPSPSPSSQPSASAAPLAPANQNPVPGGGGSNVALLMLLGSLFVTGLGGALFVGYLRRRG